jgi:VIT1/CCC1 family predicted Fe2+/Mn2+ transporter/rubrerythrin
MGAGGEDLTPVGRDAHEAGRVGIRADGAEKAMRTEQGVSHDVSNEEVARRLSEGWRGEVEAQLVYEILADREHDHARADVLRRIAAGEAGHRSRLEARMRDLGVPIPDPAQVTLSAWNRLQARIAPIQRLLAWREAAESQEIDDRYKMPTGDAETDALLAEIRKEERSHASAVAEMRKPPAPAGQAAVRDRLARILGRERHRGGGGWISGAIYGANDGLAAVFGIIAGVSGATGGSAFVLTAGLSGAIASALSMATGAYLAERSEAEVGEANIALERREIAENPDEEREELSLFYQLKGMSQAEADELAARLAKQPEAMLGLLAAEEFGGDAVPRHPFQAAAAAGISTGVGAMIPVLPFFFLRGMAAVLVAAAVSLIAHFAVGAAKSLVTLRSWWASGLEMTAAGVLVGGVLYAVGLALKVSAA